LKVSTEMEGLVREPTFYLEIARRPKGLRLRHPALLLPGRQADLPAAGSVRMERLAEAGGVRSALPVSLHAAHSDHVGVQDVAGPVPRAAVREAHLALDDDRVYPSDEELFERVRHLAC
jgi:hypothetical protein